MFFRHKKITILTIVAVIGLVTVVCLAAASGKRKPGASGAAADKSNVHGLVFAIRPTGFDPAQVELEKGTYLFIVQNRCGIRDLTFRLEREAGARLHEVHDQKLQWKKQFDLNPGTYILSVADHPEWRSVITVKAH
jgi:hypothetical protein